MKTFTDGALLLTFILNFGLSFTAQISYAAEPVREKGLSVHMLPKQVSDLDKTGKVNWGFIVGPQESSKDKSWYFQDVKKLVKYFKTLPASVQKNGIWVVTTHPDAYSQTEKDLLENLIQICKKEGISVFHCRGSELPGGWQRLSSYSQAKTVAS